MQPVADQHATEDSCPSVTVGVAAVRRPLAAPAVDAVIPAMRIAMIERPTSRFILSSSLIATTKAGEGRNFFNTDGRTAPLLPSWRPTPSKRVAIRSSQAARRSVIRVHPYAKLYFARHQRDRYTTFHGTAPGCPLQARSTSSTRPRRQNVSAPSPIRSTHPSSLPRQ